MPRLGIAKDFLSGYADLDKHVRREVEKAIGMFREHTHAGLHLEKLKAAKDPNIRTIKITNFWRGVVLAPQRGDEYWLLAVLPHNDAYAFATSRMFSVNHAIGVLEVRNQEALETIEPALVQMATSSEVRLFDAFKDHDLVRLGVDEKLLPLIRLLTTEAHLDTLSSLLPIAQYDALVALASGMTLDEAWQEVSKHLVGAEPPAEIDTEDLSAAAQRMPEKYLLVSGPAELADALAHPFDVWRVFLDDRQRRLARKTYRGPVLVSGGAGTGKTVTAVHRAAFLANQQPADKDASILLTTFTRDLASALRDQVDLVISDEDIRNRVEVVNVDKLANRIVTEAYGQAPDIARRPTLQSLWRRAATHEFSATFLEREWEQVILAQGITDLTAYQRCDRPGRGKALGLFQKQRAWDAIGVVLGELCKLGKHTHLQVAAEAARLATERSQTKYRHVIVDEGQDLHPAQWRLLRALAPQGQDDLFIVADPNQRIYNNRVSLGSLGIKVVGRSHRLTVNYRTTQEILNWSVRVLGRAAPHGLDDEPDRLAGYRSPIHGRRPIARGFAHRDAELEGLVVQINEWLAAGAEAGSIGVAARTNGQVERAGTALAQAGIPHGGSGGVQVGTMHGMKGHEFRCMAVIGVDDDVVPATWSITPTSEDPVSHKHDLQRERSLLFVACTRARDSLYVSHTATPSEFLSAPSS